MVCAIQILAYSKSYIYHIIILKSFMFLCDTWLCDHDLWQMCDIILNSNLKLKVNKIKIKLKIKIK